MKKIRIGGVPEHFNLPWHLGMEEGIFQKEGITLSWKDYPDGTGAMARDLKENKLDAAVILTEGIVKQIIDGNPVKIVQEYIASPLIWGIHVASSSSHQSLEDLRNEKAAISRFGSGSHLMAYVNAKNAGWNPEELQFEVVKDIDGAVDALQKNKAGYFLWEHFTTKPLVDEGIFRRLGDCPTPWPCFVIAVREDFLREHPEAVQTMLHNINKTTSAFKTIPAIDEVLSKKYGQTIADINQWLDITTWSQKQISVAEIERVQEQLLELDIIPRKIENTDFLHYF